MDKIICNVCGTAYPENAPQCPICGYVHASKIKNSEAGAAGYQATRGGHFSNSNVRRRSSNNGTPERKNRSGRNARLKCSNLILGIVAILLIALVIWVIVLLGSKLFGNTDKPETEDGVTVSSTTSEKDDVLRLCQELHTQVPVIELAAEGATSRVSVNPIPADTTDPITYVSMNPDIVSVTEDGIVTAVTGGQTAITVQCGKAILIVTVKCTFAPPVPEGGSWSMNRKDITLSKKGETWDLYSKNSTIAKHLIIWTSDDESVATIEGGVVKAVGRGKTVVHGECNGVKYSCTIRCNIPEDAEGEPEESEPDKSATDPAVEPTTKNNSAKISHEDVTLKPDGNANEKSFHLYLLDGDGNKLDVVWTASEEGYVKIEGNLITAVKAGKSISVSTTYEGVTYKCTIRLK